MYRVLTVIVFLLLVSVSGSGQSSFMGITPGVSERADVERALGQPVREVSDTLSEYKTQNETEKIFVQYRSNAPVVERVEAIYPAARDRASLIRALRLPASATASQINSKGKLEEYFATANIVLTYASGEAGEGVSRVGYYSRDLFESAGAKVPRNPQGNRGANPPVAKRPESPEAAPRATQSPAPSTGTSTQVGRATTGTRSTPSTNPASKSSVMRIPDALRDRADTGAPPDLQTPDDRDLFSGDVLDRLVGKYEFDAQDEPLLENVVVDGVDGKLRWNAGSTAYFLVASGTGQVSDANGKIEKNILQFKLVGKPGVKVQFTLRRGRVEQVTYLEEKPAGMLYVLGFPKRRTH
jgi:hypothetical protein